MVKKCQREKNVMVLSRPLWNGANLSLQVYAPLVNVLQLVDGDGKSSMGFLVGGIEDERKK